MLTMEPESPPRLPLGEKAQHTVNKWRMEIEDDSRTEELEREFPSLACHLGRSGLYLANAAANRAGTFKMFGATVGMQHLKDINAPSVYAFSAGNHARALVVAARLAEMELHIGVPTTAPPAKSEQGLRELWDDPRLHVHVVGNTLEETKEWMGTQPGFGELLHPFDDPYVIAGQGTVADMILDADIGADVKHVVLPIGGGGLAAGVVQRLNERGRHDITVHAMEGPGNDSASRSLAAGEIVDATGPNKRYGGAAVLRMGELAFATLNAAPNFKIHPVSNEAVATVTETYAQDREDLWRRDTPHFEPTTLVAVAGLAHVARTHPGEPAVVVGTGYNDALWPQH